MRDSPDDFRIDSGYFRLFTHTIRGSPESRRIFFPAGRSLGHSHRVRLSSSDLPREDHTCFALASQQPHTTKMASASALAGAFTSLGVSANRTAKKTNVVAKKVRARVDDRFSRGGYRRMGRRRHHPTPRSAAIRQRETGRIQRRLPRALHGCLRPKSICLVASRGTDQRGRSRAPILGRHGCSPSAAIATRDEERRRGFTLARPVPHRLTVRQPTPLLSPGVLRPLCGALCQARSDGASPQPSLSRPRYPG